MLEAMEIKFQLYYKTHQYFEYKSQYFFDSSRIDLDSDLLNNAIFEDPQLVNAFSQGVNDPLLYKIQNNSVAIGNGKLISEVMTLRTI